MRRVLDSLLRLGKLDDEAIKDLTQTADRKSPERQTEHFELARNLKSEYSSAKDWLRERNAVLMEDWFFGWETSWSGDVENGTFVASGPETSEVQFPLRVIGTFDPSDGLFCWADCDPSMPENCRADLSLVRKIGDQVGAPELTLSSPQKMKFNDVSAIIALAGQTIDCDGVFRGISGDHSSMFVALYERTNQKTCELTSDDKQSALEFVERYMTLQAPLDDEYFATDDSEARKVTIKKRLAIFRDHWGNHDPYWEPRSFSSPSDFDPDQYGFKHATRSPQGGVQVVFQAGPTIICFLLERPGEDWKIVSENLDFGNYVLWVD